MALPRTTHPCQWLTRNPSSLKVKTERPLPIARRPNAASLMQCSTMAPLREVADYPTPAQMAELRWLVRESVLLTRNTTEVTGRAMAQCVL